MIIVSNKPEYYVKKLFITFILIISLALYLEEIHLNIGNPIPDIYTRQSN